MVPFVYLCTVFHYKIKPEGIKQNLWSMIWTVSLSRLMLSSLLAKILIVSLMVFSFLQRKCHPLTRCIKKLLTRGYNVIFYLRRAQHTNIKKRVCVYHLLRSVAWSILFWLHISALQGIISTFDLHMVPTYSIFWNLNSEKFTIIFKELWMQNVASKMAVYLTRHLRELEKVFHTMWHQTKGIIFTSFEVYASHIHMYIYKLSLQLFS